MMSLLSQFTHGPPGDPTPHGVVGRRVDVVPPARAFVDATCRPTNPAPADVETARRIGRTLLATVGVDDDALARLEADVDERVDVWTPSVRLRSRFELISALANADDTIGDIAVVFTESAASSSTVLLEWSATGRFTGPALLNDDELIEPTGTEVRVDGVLGLSFSDGHRPTQIRCYYDRLSLIEQLVRAAPRGRRRGDRWMNLPGGHRLRLPGRTAGHDLPRSGRTMPVTEPGIGRAIIRYG